MTKVIRMSLDPASVDAAVKELRDYQKGVKEKARRIAERLADYGLTRIQIGFAAVPYDEENREVSTSVEKRGENTFAVVAGGKDVLFLEFGAGIRYGSGHPLAGQFGYGPGTYPGQTHVPEPGYWWFTGKDGQSHYSAGNAPGMVMYMTGMDMENEVMRVAKEVFNS